MDEIQLGSSPEQLDELSKLGISKEEFDAVCAMYPAQKQFVTIVGAISALKS